jgi:hypothetical protein
MAPFATCATSHPRSREFWCIDAELRSLEPAEEVEKVR